MYGIELSSKKLTVKYYLEPSEEEKEVIEPSVETSTSKVKNTLSSNKTSSSGRTIKPVKKLDL